MMQYYSSDSEEEDDFQWDPNEHVDLIIAEGNPQERQQLKMELLEKFLTLRHPMMSAKMSAFMESEGMVTDLMGFVTRIGENPDKPNELVPTQRLCRVVEDVEFDGETRRSFNVMSLFSSRSSEFHDFAANHLEDIVTQLFDCFKPESNGNFYHFNTILQNLLTRLPVEVTEVILSKQLLWSMLDYLHESAVLEIAIALMCCVFPKQSDSIQFFKNLVKENFFGHIGARLFGEKAHPGNSLDIAEFLGKVFEKLSMVEVSGVLFMGMCRTSAFLDGLLEAISDPEQKKHIMVRQACATVSRDLLVRSGEKLFDQTDFGAKPMPNMLSSVFDKLHSFATRFLPKICEIFIISDEKRPPAKPRRYQSYVVERPLGLLRLTMTEIVVDLVTNDAELLGQLPPRTWRVMSGWFLTHCHHTLYQGLFVRMLRQAIMYHHEDSLRACFQKAKFLTNMLKHHDSDIHSDARGFILLLLNTIRLKAELLPPDAFLRHYLTSHDIWNNFMPELRAQTLIQTRKYQDMSDEFLLDDDDEDDEDDEGIDLGSAYARSLGFEEEIGWVAPGSATDIALNGHPEVPQPAAPVATPESAPETASESAEGKLSKSQKRRRRRTRGGSMKAKQDDAAVAAEPSTGQQQSPTWWKDLVTDISEEEKSAPSSEDQNAAGGASQSPDWWKEFTDEIESAGSQ